MRIPRTSTGGLLVLALALTGAACTSSTPEASGTPAPTGVATSPTESPSHRPSPSKSPKPSASPIVGEGRNFVYVKAVDPVTPTLTFDLALFYSGEEANQIAGERGDEVPVPNDVYIVNDNAKLRTIPLTADVEILAYDWHTCCDDYTAMTLDRWAGYVAAPTRRFHGATSPYWITVRDGEVVKVEEQYLP